MFYEPHEGHGLKHNPFNAIVTPRPIGWISTRDKKSIDNIAPYSFFNAVAYVPPQVMFASNGEKSDRESTKDSVANIRETKEFCVNIVSYEMRYKMNATSKSLPAGIDEFEHAELKKIDCNFKMPQVLKPYMNYCGVSYENYSIAKDYNGIIQLLFSGKSKNISEKQRKLLEDYYTLNKDLFYEDE